MPKYIVCKLKHFRGGLHLARGLTNAYDKTLDQLHSDTIKSALFVCALQLYSEEEIGGKRFWENFNISSAFPFFHSPSKECILYFFPKPNAIRLPFQIKGLEVGQEKKLKKVRYVEQKLFERLLHGEQNIELTEEDFHGSFVADPQSSLVQTLQAEGCESVMLSEPYQHVFIPRGQETDSQPYYVDKIFFHQNAGLFFLLETKDSNTETQVKAAMQLLADHGIGTDRNIGNGQFECDFDTLDLQAPHHGDMDLNLSLYCPKEEEVQGLYKQAYYTLTKRGGYISSPDNTNMQSIRKKSIYMFSEGSLFPHLPQRTGKIVDLSPDSYLALSHPIWRDGRSLFVPSKIKE